MSHRNGHRRFAVLSAPRSGSTWLIDLLRRSTEATVHTELFIPRRKPRSERRMTAKTAAYLDANLRGLPLFCEVRRKGMAIRPFRTFGYLRRVYRSPDPTGFKLMYPNLLHFPEIWLYLSTVRCPVLHLVRTNHLDVYLSGQFRFATDTAHALVGEPKTEVPCIELDPEDLLRSMRRSKRNIRIARLLLKVTCVPHLELHYERLVESGEPLEQACRFLGLRVHGTSADSPLRKLVTGSHAQLIANYEAIRCALQGTEFEDLLGKPVPASEQG